MVGRYTEVVNFFSGLGVPAQVVTSQYSQFRSFSLSASDVLLVQAAEQDLGDHQDLGSLCLYRRGR